MRSCATVPVVPELPAHIAIDWSSLRFGGHSEVYRGYDHLKRRSVAIKFLNGERANSREGQERFRREADWMCRVRGPHVPEVYAFVDTPVLACIIMEYLPGETLEERIANPGKRLMDTAECQHVGAELADATAAAHDVGVCHRDIKPGNVMCGPDGAVHLFDWGIATNRSWRPPPLRQQCLPLDDDKLTCTDQVLGTAAYMAPESWQAGVVGPAADVYGVGATLFHGATGRPPIEADDPQRLGVIVQVVEPPPLAELRPDLPAAFSETIDHTLAKDPDDRPDPIELEEALLAVAA